jgi:hypothetical protein
MMIILKYKFHHTVPPALKDTNPFILNYSDNGSAIYALWKVNILGIMLHSVLFLTSIFKDSHNTFYL